MIVYYVSDNHKTNKEISQLFAAGQINKGLAFSGLDTAKQNKGPDDLIFQVYIDVTGGS